MGHNNYIPLKKLTKPSTVCIQMYVKKKKHTKKKSIGKVSDTIMSY